MCFLDLNVASHSQPSSSVTSGSTEPTTSRSNVQSTLVSHVPLIETQSNPPHVLFVPSSAQTSHGFVSLSSLIPQINPSSQLTTPESFEIQVNSSHATVSSSSSSIEAQVNPLHATVSSSIETRENPSHDPVPSSSIKAQVNTSHALVSSSSSAKTQVNPSVITIQASKLKCLRKMDYVCASDASTQTSLPDLLRASDLFKDEVDVCVADKTPKSKQEHLNESSKCLIQSQVSLIIELKQQVDDLTEKDERAQRAVEERNLELNKYENLVSLLQSEIDDLQNQLQDNNGLLALQDSIDEIGAGLDKYGETKFNDLQKQFQQQLDILSAQIEDLTNDNEYLHAKVDNLETTCDSLETELDKYKKVLSERFSEDEVRRILGVIKKVKVYKTEPIARYTMLSILGRKKYELVRKLLNLPWPSYRTLHRKRQKLQMKEGLCQLGLDLLEARMASHNLSEIETQVFIELDETTTDNRVDFDGEHVVETNTILVVRVKSITCSYTQVVYTSFDKDFPKEKMLEIISRLHAMGYNVRAITSDNGPKNRKLWRQLMNKRSIVNGERVHHYFFHPNTNRRIYIFSDMSHNIKLFRNHLLKKTLVCPNGTRVNISPIKDLKDQVPGLKLTNEHFNPTDFQRTKLALDIVNKEIANIIADENLAESLNVVRDYFDAFNITNKNAGKDGRHDLFGVENSHQINAILDKTIDYVGKMKFVPHNSQRRIEDVKRKPFQDGIMMSCMSMKAIAKGNICRCIHSMPTINYLIRF